MIVYGYALHTIEGTGAYAIIDFKVRKSDQWTFIELYKHVVLRSSIDYIIIVVLCGLNQWLRRAAWRSNQTNCNGSIKKDLMGTGSNPLLY